MWFVCNLFTQTFFFFFFAGFSSDATTLLTCLATVVKIQTIDCMFIKHLHRFNFANWMHACFWCFHTLLCNNKHVLISFAGGIRVHILVQGNPHFKPLTFLLLIVLFMQMHLIYLFFSLQDVWFCGKRCWSWHGEHLPRICRMRPPAALQQSRWVYSGSHN